MKRSTGLLNSVLPAEFLRRQVYRGLALRTGRSRCTRHPDHKKAIMSSQRVPSRAAGSPPRGSPDRRYVCPTRLSPSRSRAPEDFGWTEKSLFDVFLLLTEIPLAPEEFEYRDRLHGVPDPPPWMIAPQPRPKAPVIGPLPKATMPPHPSTIQVNRHIRGFEGGRKGGNVSRDVYVRTRRHFTVEPFPYTGFSVTSPDSAPRGLSICVGCPRSSSGSARKQGAG